MRKRVTWRRDCRSPPHYHAPGAWRHAQRCFHKVAVRLARIKMSCVCQMSSDEFQWSFGFGSNMNVAYMESRKGLKVHDFTPAVLEGFKLAFRVGGLAYWEPSWANIVKTTDGQVHGVATKLSKEDAEKLANQERAYVRVFTDFHAYDGRIIRGFFFACKPERLASEEIPCSDRYHRILIKGARDAGLRDSYIELLQKMPIYNPPLEILQKRATFPLIEDLPAMTWSEFSAKAEEETAFYSILGLIVQRKPITLFLAKNRDLTGFWINFHRGIEKALSNTSLADLDGGPYPRITDLSDQELEYCHQGLDFLVFGEAFSCHPAPTTNIQPKGCIVAKLKEFHDKQ